MTEQLTPEVVVEQIDVCADNTAARVILNAMATFIRDADFSEKFGGNGRMCSVEMKVNGHPVPIVEALVDAWKRADEQLEERARKMALQMVTEAGLEPIATALRDAERMIRDKLKNYDYE